MSIDRLTLIRNSIPINQCRAYIPIMCVKRQLQTIFRGIFQFVILNLVPLGHCHVTLMSTSCHRHVTLGIFAYFGAVCVAQLFQDKEGDTPLSFAVQNGHTAATQLLLKHNAYVDARNLWAELRSLMLEREACRSSCSSTAPIERPKILVKKFPSVNLAVQRDATRPLPWKKGERPQFGGTPLACLLNICSTPFQPFASPGVHSNELKRNVIMVSRLP